MKQLLHVLYVTEEDAALSLSGECVLLTFSDGRKQLVPLHHLDRIVSFSYLPATPQLADACVQKHIGLVFLTPHGRFRFQITGPVRGNVMLRLSQYRLSDSEPKRLELAQELLRHKLRGQLYVLGRFRRNHPELDQRPILRAEGILRDTQEMLSRVQLNDVLLGMEGQSAQAYFSAFDAMILCQDPAFSFDRRTRRPPENRCNAMLSFAYTLLAAECAGALEEVGLDPCVGFLHRERSGKPALALDLLEEFRATLADRFVLRVINLNIIRPEWFETHEDGGVYLNDEGRKRFLEEWNRLRAREIFVSDLGEKLPQGLLIHLQALKLARYIRGEDPRYAPLIGG